MKFYPGVTRSVLLGVLALHAAMLAYASTQYSPTVNEPAHLAAGLWCWTTGTFERYRVNPPLVKLWASLPVLLVGYENVDAPSRRDQSRPEFAAGRRFVNSNGARSVFLVRIARWACIPFSLIGAATCYLWAAELYGRGAGLLSGALWGFSPDILGHGALITADAHAAALAVAAGYAFWKWLGNPTWGAAIVSGILLGAAQLAKSTLLLLPPLWIVLWLTRWCSSRRDNVSSYRKPGGLVLVAIIVISIYCVHLGYGFCGSFAPVPNDFHSSFFRALLGAPSGAPGRPEAAPPALTGAATAFFRRLAPLLPRDYLLGIDEQQADFESASPIPCYLAGTFSARGWWYFYIYALLVKLPLGVIALVILTTGCRLFSLFSESNVHRTWFDDFAVLAPALLIFTVVSTETGFSRHARYALPSLPFLFVWLGQAIPLLRLSAMNSVRTIPVALGLSAILSCLASYPHSLSYFNEIAGGLQGGPRHLIDSSVDWGQDLLRLKHWQDSADEHRDLSVALYCALDPRKLGLRCSPIVASEPRGAALDLSPGWYAISASLLEGMPWYSIPRPNRGVTFYPSGALAPFRSLSPARRVGASIVLFRVDRRRRLGIPARLRQMGGAH